MVFLMVSQLRIPYITRLISDYYSGLRWLEFCHLSTGEARHKRANDVWHLLLSFETYSSALFGKFGGFDQRHCIWLLFALLFSQRPFFSTK